MIFPFSLSCLLVCWVRLSFRVIGLCSFVSFPFCSACFLLSLSLSLLALSLSYVTLGCCAWSFWPQTGPDFQRHPHFPFFSSASLARPSHFSSFNIVPVWCFWPQTGQRYHFAGSSLSFQLSTVSGRRLVQGLLRYNSDSWSSLLDSKQSRPG